MLQLLLEQAACCLPNGDVVTQHLRSPRFGALLMLRHPAPLQHTAPPGPMRFAVRPRVFVDALMAALGSSQV